MLKIEEKHMENDEMLQAMALCGAIKNAVNLNGKGDLDTAGVAMAAEVLEEMGFKPLAVVGTDPLLQKPVVLAVCPMETRLHASALAQLN